VGVLLLGGCMPRGDLAGYSEGHVEQQPNALQPAPAQDLPSTEDRVSAGNESDPSGPLGPSEESAPSLANLAPPDAPAELGSANPTVFGADAGTADAGAANDAGGAGSVDAGVLTAADAGSTTIADCTGAGGTLAPDAHTCVFVAADQLSWTGAVAACAADGRQLISIKSPELDSFLTPLLTEDSWIGARDPAMLNPASNLFVWLDGTPASTTNWALGEPDAQANQYCITKTSAAPNGPWRDRPCAELKAYVCEQAF
jgi:hypothetical protein